MAIATIEEPVTRSTPALAPYGAAWRWPNVIYGSNNAALKLHQVSRTPPKPSAADSSITGESVSKNFAKLELSKKHQVGEREKEPEAVSDVSERERYDGKGPGARPQGPLLFGNFYRINILFSLFRWPSLRRSVGFGLFFDRFLLFV
ncbi:hypothetical protein GWI33_000947 [Rhynchophorus ferrugineus]|uniref:Uncharacterized protein n=1 Tax=Rhynchophorus ferrugineus TaxID=354439 RepID=A0A834MGP1_RHYFE|nr:hypothetical protein GWI33_000947 [Rhynchophorus ferrugineus]